MDSPLFHEWVEEERKEAAKEATEKAQKDTTKKNILDILLEKFDFVPKDIREDIGSIDDIGVLDGLVKKIIKVDTIDDFKNLLQKVKNM